MKLLSSVRTFLSFVFRRGHIERDMDEEFRSHLAIRVGELERQGLSRAEAGRQARIEFGSYQQYKEECREALGTRLFQELWQDLRYGLRQLRRSPGFTTVAVITLALGVGATTAIFTVVYTALLRPLPYEQPDHLLTISEAREAQGTYWESSYPDYLDWIRQSKSFESIAAFNNDSFVYRGASESQMIFGAQATTNFFSTLGVKPVLGRDFAPGEDSASGPSVALLTYSFWQTQYGGDPRAVGRTMHLDTHDVTVVGVLPPQFEFGPASNAQVWVPLHLGGDLAEFGTRRNLRWIHVIGRLARGVTKERAKLEMDSINARLVAAYPEANATIQIRLVPLRERIVGQVQPLLLILFGAVGFVLLIACANVANLLMVRAAGRRREFAIRGALGASRGRLVAQLLAESLMLAAAGGTLGFVAAQWGTSALVAAIPDNLLYSMPFLRDARPNSAIFIFFCGIAVFTGILSGLAPALHVASEKLTHVLKEETRTAAGRHRTRLRNALVILEIASSLVLLAGAGLTVKSLSALLRRNPGFDIHNVLTFGVNLPTTSYPKDPDVVRFDKTFAARATAVPGVLGVANTTVVPLTGGGNTVRFAIEGQLVATGHENECDIRDVSDNYFSVLKIPLLAGRYFSEAADAATAPNHIIVNEAWVKAFLHGKSPLGERIRFTFSPTQPYREIVGVVGDIADGQLDSHAVPAVFCPFSQDSNSYLNYIVRTSGNPAIALGEMRNALRSTDPQLFPILPLTMEEIIDQSPSVFLRRYPSYLIGSFAVLALLLACVGLYGLLSYSVSQRTNEVGIRMALGAEKTDVLKMVVSQGLKLVLIGVAIGIAGALALTRFLASLLYGVEPTDPLTFIAVSLILIAVALAACYIPARRAARVDPMVALRYE